MNNLMKKISRIMVLAMILTCIPIGVLGANSETIEKDPDNRYNLVIGTNYILSGTVKYEDGIVISFYNPGASFDGDADADIVSAVSSDEAVATAEVAFGSYVGVDVKKQAGTVNVTVKDSSGKTSIIQFESTGQSEKKAKITSVSNVFKYSKKVTIKAKNVKKGDVVKLVIGKKTYTKKISKTAATAKIKISIKKPDFYGKKYTLTIKRKGKVMATKKAYVYLGDTVYVGYTKKKVKWLIDWKDPDKKNYTAYSEQWCYDWDGNGLHDAYLYFDNNGRVRNWQIFDS